MIEIDLIELANIINDINRRSYHEIYPYYLTHIYISTLTLPQLRSAENTKQNKTLNYTSSDASIAISLIKYAHPASCLRVLHATPVP